MIKNLFRWIFLAIALLFFIFISASTTRAQNKKCIYYFYGSSCPHCANVKPVLEDLEKKYPDLKINRYEIYEDKDNAKLFQNFLEHYKVLSGDRGVPIIFVGDEYIVGDTPIISMLEEYVTSSSEIKCISSDVIAGVNKENTDQDNKETKNSNAFSLSAIIGAALVDSINPCAIAVFLILLSSLIFLHKDKKDILRTGLAFIFAVFIAYFLLGLGLLTFIKATNISYWLYRIIGGLAIVVGLWNIKDYFWYKVGPNIEIPKSFRKSLKSLLRGVISPFGAFVVGLLVGIFELPCTGGPYIFALGVLAESSISQTIPLLLIYNLFFILPLFIVLGLIYFGTASVSGAKKWQKENFKKLHLVAGIIMLILGVVVIWGLF